jgi:hypothetical protein
MLETNYKLLELKLKRENSYTNSKQREDTKFLKEKQKLKVQRKKNI